MSDARQRLDHEAARAFVEAVPPGRLRDRLAEEYLEGLRRGYCLRQLVFGFEGERYTGMAYGLLAELSTSPTSPARHWAGSRSTSTGCPPGMRAA